MGYLSVLPGTLQIVFFKTTKISWKSNLKEMKRNKRQCTTKLAPKYLHGPLGKAKRQACD